MLECPVCGSELVRLECGYFYCPFCYSLYFIKLPEQK